MTFISRMGSGPVRAIGVLGAAVAVAAGGQLATGVASPQAARRVASVAQPASHASAGGRGTTAGRTAAAAGRRWVASWQGSPTAAGIIPGLGTCPSPEGLRDRTVRNLVAGSVAGDRVRVRLTNAFGARPLAVGRASVAVQRAGARTEPGTMRQLRFGGQRAVTIPPGAQALSDPVQLAVRPLRKLALSVYLPGPTGPATQHYFAIQDNYLSRAGDHALSESPANFPNRITCWLFISGVDVRTASRVRGTVVTLGDSITDGAQSTQNADHRYPDFLARRLAARTGSTLSVVNAGISGDEVLAARQPALFGPGTVARLPRDVVAQPGVRVAIFKEGTNDIGAEAATARQLIAAHRQTIAQLHAQGIAVVGATLTPFGGSHEQFGGEYGTARGDRERRALNFWIRTSGEYDAIVDFDRVTRDPAHPESMRPEYDSGDHLHPGDAGYAAMARAVDLGALLALAGVDDTR
jgi:lysophospholipase L1-like esterase